MEYLLKPNVFLFEENGEYFLTEIIDKDECLDYKLSYKVYKELERANGIRKLDLSSNEIELLMDYDLITDKRLIFNGLFKENYFTLFLTGNAHKYKRIYKYLESILSLYLTTFIVGLLSIFVFPISYYNFAYSSTIFLFLLIISILMHEFAHLCLAICNNCKSGAIGLIFYGLFIKSAYTSFYGYYECKRKEKIEIDFAGIKAQLMMEGIMMLLLHIFNNAGIVYFLKMNALLIFVNLIPAYESDGDSIFSLLLFKDETRMFSEVAKDSLNNKSIRKKMFHSKFGIFMFLLYKLPIFLYSLLFIYILIHLF